MKGNRFSNSARVHHDENLGIRKRHVARRKNPTEVMGLDREEKTGEVGRSVSNEKRN